ncbi:helix-turn-helix domain-containing protein [Desulfovibrio sp. OttesenSCG-928-C14]|nr:helix-turn-helix domain-containing protein [Desulfovibrio sp. OttesenSCG-928-C14]
MAGKKLGNDEAADFLGVKPNTLEVWRTKKKGPKYSKIGSRVLYDVNDLEEYFASRSVHTKDTAPQLRSGK